MTPLCVQLYSVRDDAALDFAGVLTRLGQVGFVGVELAGFHGMAPAELARRVADNGLVVSSAHVNSSGPSDAFAAALDDLARVGCDTVIMPFLPPDAFADLDAVKRSADALNQANQVARSHGFTFGYHNHFWEFEREFDGRSALFYLYDLLADDIVAELDVYWARVGGADPIEAIGRLGSRVRLLHVKDGPADDRKAANVAVGNGSIDVAGVLTAAPDVAWHVVEFDRCDTDVFAAIEESYGFLVGLGYSRGRR